MKGLANQLPSLTILFPVQDVQAGHSTPRLPKAGAENRVPSKDLDAVVDLPGFSGINGHMRLGGRLV